MKVDLHDLKKLAFAGKVLIQDIMEYKTHTEKMQNDVEEYRQLISRLFLTHGACCEDEDCECEE